MCWYLHDQYTSIKPRCNYNTSWIISSEQIFFCPLLIILVMVKSLHKTQQPAHPWTCVTHSICTNWSMEMFCTTKDTLPTCSWSCDIGHNTLYHHRWLMIWSIGTLDSVILYELDWTRLVGYAYWNYPSVTTLKRGRNYSPLYYKLKLHF